MLFSQQRITPNWRDLAAGFFPQPTAVLHRFIEHPYQYWTGSGREALRLVLSHCHVEKGISRVGVPAFTCQVVLDAVRRSGCTPVFYDSGVVAEPTDIIRFLPKVEALILAYNFGFVPKIDEIASACRRRGIILIEDCAQALGARWQNKLAGGFGDYAIYSFGISKNIGFCGGLIASKEQMILPKLPHLPFHHVREAVLKTLAAPFFFSPFFYRLLHPLLQEELVQKPKPLTFGASRYARRIVLKQWKRYDGILSLRRRNFVYLQEQLISAVPQLRGQVHDAGLYFVLLEKDRRRVQQELEKMGVELGVMRTFHCFEKANSKLFSKAFRAEQEHLTLALYRPRKEIQKILKLLNQHYSSNRSNNSGNHSNSNNGDLREC